MTSKEALKTIKYTNTNHIKYSKIGMPLKLYSVGELRKTEIKTIQKDLEKLKKLEKKNKELLINKNVAQKIAIKLKNDNDKFKKVIEIFIKFIDIHKPIDFDTFLNFYYNEDDICLVKEVLKNERS